MSVRGAADDADAEVEAPHIIGDPGATLAFRTWPGASNFLMRAIHGREAGVVKYTIEPRPHEGFPDEVSANLSRPIEGLNYFAQVLLDPTVRYNVTVTNVEPQRKLKFVGAYAWLASE